MTNILAVIPVRGGSKGVSRKNLRPVAGRPLLEWTISQALACKPGLDVLVSTDDEEIAAVARAAGADVPFMRPAELAQDITATEPVVQHAIEFRRQQGRAPEVVMLLQATSPLRLPGTLARAVSEFLAGDYDSTVGVVPESPFFWSLGEISGEVAAAAYDYRHRPRRQDLRAEDLRYRETGSVYLTKPWVYDDLQNRLGGRIGLFVMDESEGIDIDSEVDLLVADAKLREMNSLLGSR